MGTFYYYRLGWSASPNLGWHIWTYMRENRVDLPYLFLHPGLSIVTNLAHPEEIFKKIKR